MPLFLLLCEKWRARRLYAEVVIRVMIKFTFILSLNWTVVSIRLAKYINTDFNFSIEGLTFARLKWRFRVCSILNVYAPYPLWIAFERFTAWFLFYDEIHLNFARICITGHLDGTNANFKRKFPNLHQLFCEK